MAPVTVLDLVVVSWQFPGAVEVGNSWSVAVECNGRKRRVGDDKQVRQVWFSDLNGRAYNGYVELLRDVQRVIDGGVNPNKFTSPRLKEGPSIHPFKLEWTKQVLEHQVRPVPVLPSRSGN